MKHQGSRGGSTLEEVGEAAGDSKKTVQRYVWLARLIPGLLEMVDAKRIGISQGAELSFLSAKAQEWIFAVVQETGVCGIVEMLENKTLHGFCGFVFSLFELFFCCGSSSVF